ncbi:MAG TPA: integrin alpha [Xanthomonadales bacterium]|nr:integrin alpha [Xanthomonadales bacterium]
MRVIFCLCFLVLACASHASGLQPTSPQSGPSSPESSWLSEAQRELANREYQLSFNELGLQAPNRAQGFRSYITATGVDLVRRTGASEALAGVNLTSVGRTGSDVVLGHADVFSQGSQATLQWPGVSVQYLNTPTGLHQAITLDQSPAGSGLVEIVLGVTDAQPRITSDGIALSTPGSILQMGSIEAHDASGRSLPVTLDTSSGSASSASIRVAVSDKSATYPIKLQTVISGGYDDILLSTDPNSDFGDAVSAAGDVNGDGYADVLIGAQLYDSGEVNEGVAFLFLGGPGDFDTTPDATLQANQASAQFGNSVAGAGDVNGDGYADVVIGAYRFNNTASAQGSAFVYFGGPGSFNTTADATLAVNQGGENFGYSVAGAGDVNGDGYADVIIGARNYDNPDDNEGGAFIFFGGTGAFDLAADAILESNDGGAQFGSSVAGAGDVNGDGYADVVVGAPNYGTVESGESDEGAAFIYFGGSGAFDTTADAQLESNQTGSDFGTSVAGAGDVNGDGYADVIVGAPNYTNDQANEGVALLYFGGSGSFNPVADVLLQGTIPDADFGASVAGAGDINGDGYADVLVGAPLQLKIGVTTGSVFVYFGGAGAFSTTAGSILHDSEDGAQFGGSVAGPGDLNGDGYADVLVGARNFDNTANGNEGSAFVFFGGAGRITTTVDALIESNKTFTELGSSVAGAGDVNGDGYSDVILGAYSYDNGENNEGAAFIYFGGSGAFDFTADAVIESNQLGAILGWSVAGAGDVNGDGYSDVIVGAPQYQNTLAKGVAFIYFGSSGSFDITADAILEYSPGGDFGHSVAGAGDVNGDGFADVIVGAPFISNGNIEEGVAFIYFGGASAFDTTPDALLEVDLNDADMGYSVSGAGDVNGDGYADVIVGARSYSNGQNNEGAALIYFGGSGPFNNSFDALLQLNLTDARMGWSVAAAGDVNGDGFADVVIGGPGYANGQANEGAAFIYFGSNGAFNGVQDAVLQPNEEEARMGWGVAGAGDVNGDGYADVIVGAPGITDGQVSEGAAYIYYGGSGTFNVVFDARLQSNVASSNLGASVAGVGDVNGDGFADVIAGASGYENGQSSEGAAFLYYGTARGRQVLSRQFEGNGTDPVQPWNRSQQSDGFVAKMNATSPRGRERARMQLEACPEGAQFGSLLCDNFTATSWTEIGANPQGVTLSLAASGLTTDRLYHWRARVQYAPLHVTQPGVVAPLKPAAGPWRRFQANGDLADIRISTSGPMMELIFEDGFETP